MSLDCIGSESFSLFYQIGGIQEYVNVLYPGIGNGSDYYQSQWIGQIGETLSFQVEHDLTKDRYHAYGTFVDISADGSGETMYYEHGWINELIRESFELDDSGVYWVYSGVVIEGATQGDRTVLDTVYKVEEEQYLNALTEDNDLPPRTRNFRVRAPNPDGITAYPAASELSAPQLVRYGYNTYNILIFADGQLVNTVTTTGSRETRYAPGDDIAVKDEVEVTTFKSDIFTKDSPSQGVEVLLAPGEPYKKEVWLVDLDESGEETGRRKIFEFEMLPNQGTPQHSIECIFSPGECPENTCAVNCSTHMCCYNAEGEPIHSYEL